MTQEEKQLLLKDLSARLPYGVKYKTYLDDVFTLKDITLSRNTTEYYIDDKAFSLSQIKPYLRPMSTITKEEFDELNDTACLTLYPNGKAFPNGKDYDWLNAHHFDYRGLISKGLALQSLEGMY